MIKEKDLNLPQFLKEHESEIHLAVDALGDQMTRLDSLNYADETAIQKRDFDSKLSKAKKRLMQRFIEKTLATEFILLDRSIFERKRILKVQNIEREFVIVEDFLSPPENQAQKEGKIHTRYIEVPLLVSCDIDRDEAHLGCFPLPGLKTRIAWLKACLPAAMPIQTEGLRIRVFQLITQAISELLQDRSCALELINSSVRSFFDVEFKVAWIPTLREISVDRIEPARKDPALLMLVGSSCFLIDAWDEPRQSPLLAVLEEYRLK